MQQMMLDMMVQMMPYMKPIFYTGVALLALGVIATLVTLANGAAAGMARVTGRLLVALGIFFLACQVAGMVLGAQPAINFGDSTKFEFILYPFWQIGLALLVPGLLILMVGGRRTTSA
jgi:hypothetical protein